jgi:AMMECR1 domain-containing protein
MIAMLCRHCRFGPVNRPRGLCWSCYNTPGVREQYPSTSKYGRHGIGNFNGRTPLPAVPTDAAPGSPEKLEVLIERAQNRQSLWHPEDAGVMKPRRRRQKLAQVG